MLLPEHTSVCDYWNTSPIFTPWNRKHQLTEAAFQGLVLPRHNEKHLNFYLLNTKCKNVVVMDFLFYFVKTRLKTALPLKLAFLQIEVSEMICISLRSSIWRTWLEICMQQAPEGIIFLDRSQNCFSRANFSLQFSHAPIRSWRIHHFSFPLGYYLLTECQKMRTCSRLGLQVTTITSRTVKPNQVVHIRSFFYFERKKKIKVKPSELAKRAYIVLFVSLSE